jgi:ATP-dependent exoDNAse (exonuclease V) beta subunit
MKASLNPILAIKNFHERDIAIAFFENEHKYVISFEPNIKYTSVTTWVHEHFEKFDSDNIINKMMLGVKWKEGHIYWGKTVEEIKSLWDLNKDSAARAGADLHYEIECFNNDKRFQFEYTNKDLYKIYYDDNRVKHNLKQAEWQYFINFIKDHPHLTPYRTEWCIYDEDVKIAGSIDMIYKNSDGSFSIYDWKRSKNISKINNFNKKSIHPIICHLPDSNFWHYALQLNTYKLILERKYGIKIRDLFLVRLHPNAEEKNYELIKVHDLTSEVRELFDEKIFNEKYINLNAKTI